MEGPVHFEILSTQEALEKKDRKLTRLEGTFFAQVVAYLDRLEQSVKKEQEKSPRSKKVDFLADELRNATNKAEELWKSREKKIVNFAQVDARKDPPPQPPEHLTKEEGLFYQALLGIFREQWHRILPSRPVPSGAPVAPLARPAAPTPVPAPTATPAPTPAVEASGDEMQTIRALVDIPAFVGLDNKTYRIKKGDVLSLPKRFVKILKDRGQVSVVG